MPELSSLSAWLAEHANLILPTVGVIAFIESFAIAGIVVPGVALLFSIAALASVSDVALMPVLVAAFIGAVAGDVSSFFIGRAFHDRLQNMWPFSRYPDAMNQGEKFFKKYGMVSVVIGRFVGPLRPVLPLTAGMLHMPSAKFISINLLSACAWAPAYILPGYLGAELSQSMLAGDHAGNSAWLALALSLSVLPWLLLLNVKGREQASPKMLVTSFTYAWLALGVLALLVVEGYFDRVDVWLFAVMTSLRNPALDPYLICLTLIGDEALLFLLFLWSVTYLLFYKQKRLALTLAMAGVCASMLTHLLKYTFNIARPELILGNTGSAAFPSGHTSGFSIYVGTLVCIALIHRSEVRTSLKYLALGLILTIASSRLLLGVHWLSDVLGGLLLGAAISASVLFCSHILTSKTKPEDIEQGKPMSWRQLISTNLVLITLYVVLFFDSASVFYSFR